MNKLSINGNDIHEPKNIAGAFNDFFCRIGPKLAQKMSNNNNDFYKYMPSKIRNSIFLHMLTIEDVKKEIRKLVIKKSPGYDEITAKFLQISECIIAKPLCQIFNTSISTGVYPDLLKIAKVIPIHKKNDKSDVINYRPISVLSSINKIF